MKHFGPIGYIRLHDKTKNFISVYLKGFENSPWGWEWGDDGCGTVPIISLRLFGLTILYFEKYKEGFYITFMGFWYMS